MVEFGELLNLKKRFISQIFDQEIFRLYMHKHKFFIQTNFGKAVLAKESKIIIIFLIGGRETQTWR